jgi:3-phosphoshikimate 1-carboxyvinyltransferase
MTTHNFPPLPMLGRPYGSPDDTLQGVARVPGDKSCSHRAILFGAMAEGETLVQGLLESGDVFSTIEACRKLGARVRYDDIDGLWHVDGVGEAGFAEPDTVLDLGNSGTTTRLLMGAIAGSKIHAVITGDGSLRKRPMQRVMTPLADMGVTFMARAGGKLPLSMLGATPLKPITYTLPVASAQLKSAIILAGLFADGETQIIEPERSRDHTENLLPAFGVDIEIGETAEGHRVIKVQGKQTLKGAFMEVPGDPSSAAFPAVAAAIRPGSSVVIPGVCVNKLRIGLFDTLIEMGVTITRKNERLQAGEKVADLEVTAPDMLKAVTVPADRAPSMIDEFPILAVAASIADGTTVMEGLAELRVKESDRLAKIAEGLIACGVTLEMGEDSLTVYGSGGKPHKGGCTITTALDHRIAMSFLIMGTICQNPVSIDDGRPIATSFPGFEDMMQNLGANIAIEGIETGLLDWQVA